MVEIKLDQLSENLQVLLKKYINLLKDFDEKIISDSIFLKEFKVLVLTIISTLSNELKLDEYKELKLLLKYFIDISKFLENKSHLNLDDIKNFEDNLLIGKPKKSFFRRKPFRNFVIAISIFLKLGLVSAEAAEKLTNVNISQDDNKTKIELSSNDNDNFNYLFSEDLLKKVNSYIINKEIFDKSIGTKIKIQNLQIGSTIAKNILFIIPTIDEIDEYYAFGSFSDSNKEFAKFDYIIHLQSVGFSEDPKFLGQLSLSIEKKSNGMVGNGYFKVGDIKEIQNILNSFEKIVNSK